MNKKDFRTNTMSVLPVFHDLCSNVQEGETQGVMVLKFSPTACKTLQEITEKQGSPVNPAHV